MTNPYRPGPTGIPESSMPTGAPGLMPRRTSYASVVAGSANSHSSQQPTRSGAFSYLLNHPNDFAYETNHQSAGANSRNDSRGFDMDMRRNSGVYGSGSRSWGHTGHLPSYSSAFASIANGHGQDGGAGLSFDHFFVPSYLRGSKYIQRLEEAHKTKLAARRDAPSAHSSQPGSLSTSNSSANLAGKLAPSHRGMTYDLIEKAPPLDDDALAPLPSKWNTHDKYGGLEVLGEGHEVKFSGSRTSSERDHEASSIRADHPMPAQCGIYYFEVTILTKKREESSIGIGFSGRDVPLSRPPGWEPDSWAYHGDDGNIFCCQSSGKHYGQGFTTGDVVGCGVNFRTGCAFFTKNGANLGTAFREIKGKLFPTVGMKKPGEHVRVNFGHSPFVFDINGMMLYPPPYMIMPQPLLMPQPMYLPGAIVFPLLLDGEGRNLLDNSTTSMTLLWDDADTLKLEQQSTHEKIKQTSTAKLAPPLDETSLIQSLVLQYLSHDGYVETARAFADEVQSEREALSIDPNLPVTGFENITEDEDGVNRQRIRLAILEGDVDKALKSTNAHYPNVLKDNEHIYFRLRSLKFIEMIRQATDLKVAKIHAEKKSNGSNGSSYDDGIDHDMEMDEPHPASNGFDKMDTEDTNGNELSSEKVIMQALQYGQTLEAEFANDPRREVTKSLYDAFALMAYDNPMDSPLSYLLKREERVSVAEELNSAILVSLGKSSSAALERLIQQTTVLIDELRSEGGIGAFINVDQYMQPYSEFPQEHER